MSKVLERFWSKVDKSGGPDACWPWTARRDPKGYGEFKVSTHKKVRANRFCLEITEGPLAEGEQALHSCDNPPCCNPAHLFAGTNQDNVDDRVAKQRNAKMAGTLNPRARLTRDVVLTCRARYVPGSKVHGATALAKEFGVSQPAMSHALSGNTWRDE